MIEFKRGTVVAALWRSIPVFFSFRMLALVIVPLIVAAVIWVVIAWVVWDPIVGGLSSTIFSWSESLGPAAAAVFAAVFLMAAAFITALLAIAVLAMPVLVDTVAARDFPNLERRRGGTFAGSLHNALRAVGPVLPLWLLSLPLLIVPPLYVVVNLLLGAWLNQRLLPYDALALHADEDEMVVVVGTARTRLLIVAIVLAPFSLVPVVNFFAALFTGIALTYVCLDELVALRRPNAAVHRVDAPTIGRLP